LTKRLGSLFLVVAMLFICAVPAYADTANRLSESSVTVEPGKSVTLSAYEGSSAASGIIWMSANESIATVDGYGKVTGVSVGRTTVRAIFPSGDTKTCTVLVSNGSSAVLNGIDVYRCQGSIDWAAVKNAGYSFVIMKCSYGSDSFNQVDPMFETYYQGAVQNGLKVGAYHYSYAMNVQEASREADVCLNTLKGRHLDYPVFYDVEGGNTQNPGSAKDQRTLSTDTLGQMVQTFCSKIQQAGYKTGVYSYKNFYIKYLTSPLVSQYDTWIAQTGVSQPNFSYPYTMWQYGQRTVPGVPGVPGGSDACDVDYSYVDYSGTSSGGSTTPTQPETPTQTGLDQTTFLCDTSAYTFGTGSKYTYKITTLDTYPPTAVSSNPSAVRVSGPTKTTNGFLFTIYNVGPGSAKITTTAGDGRSVSFTATGTGTSASVPGSSSSGSTLPCDTSSYTFQPGSSVYYYKIWSSASSAPKAVSSNPSAVAVSYSKKLNDGYLYKIQNIGSGTAVITTTASDGSAASFTAVGTSASGIVSDTPFYFTMKKGSAYQFRFTGTKGLSYRFACAGSGTVVKPVALKKIGNSYFYKITAAEKGCVGIYSGGHRVCVVTVH